MLLSLAMLVCAGAGSASPITTHSHAFQSCLPVASGYYELAQYGPVELTVHDVSGRLVRRLESGARQRGTHAVRWDGADSRGRIVPGGVYFVRLSAGSLASTGRLTLTR
jgi:hypothetical protein